MTLLAHLDDDGFAARYQIPEADEAWRRTARDTALEHIAPVVREADRTATFSREIVRALGRAGLIAPSLPESAGGCGASTLADVLVAEEIGAVDGSARGFLAVQGGLVASALARAGSSAQRERWLPALLEGEQIGCYALTENGAGSDVSALETRVRIEGDEAILDGSKIWITNGGVADVALVFATADPTKRHRGLECWIVPTDVRGFSAAPMPGRELGHRASDHARVTLEGVRVPISHRLGAPGQGFAIAMRALEHGRLHVAAGAVGAHRACLDQCVDFARTRRQFGRRVGDFQQVSATIADLAVSLEASRLLVHQAARLRDRGMDDPASVAAAKLHATEQAVAAAATSLQLIGARAYTDELPVERHYRDLVALTIYEGTSNIQRLILARGLLGKEEAGESA